MFSIGETRPNFDANGPQEEAQGTRHIRRGRLNNELLNNVKGDFRFSASSEEEGDIRKPHSKDNIAWLSKDSAVRNKERSTGTRDWNITGSTTKVGVH